jgi:hypothetical protein
VLERRAGFLVDDELVARVRVDQRPTGKRRWELDHQGIQTGHPS